MGQAGSLTHSVNQIIFLVFMTTFCKFLTRFSIEDIEDLSVILLVNVMNVKMLTVKYMVGCPKKNRHIFTVMILTATTLSLEISDYHEQMSNNRTG